MKRGLTATDLKLIAAAAMLLDHVGYFLLPELPTLRYIGRLAMPVFAFVVAESCIHTHNRLAYYLRLLCLGSLCQLFYSLATGDTLVCVPMSFALVTPLIFCRMALEDAVAKKLQTRAVLWSLLLLGMVVLIGVVQSVATIDYGFWGCLVPLAASLFPGKNRLLRLAPVALCLLGTGLTMGPWQFYSLTAIPVLYWYNGQLGHRNYKYFFYIFYPAHLAVIQMAAVLLQNSSK